MAFFIQMSTVLYDQYHGDSEEPANSICSIKEYAFAEASCKSLPTAVQDKTLPPFERRTPFSIIVPA